MKEVAVIITVLSVFILGLFVAKVAYKSEHGEVGKLVKECEANLPRNEKCVIVAVPEKNKGE